MGERRAEGRKSGMSTEKDFLASVEEFRAKVPSMQPVEHQTFCCAELREQYRGVEWPEWTGRAGVYYILNESDCVVYVGAGTAWYGVVHRVEVRIKQKNLPKTTRAGAVLLKEPDWYWAWSLEAFLIDSLNPKLNDRLRRKAKSE